jgi:hypothetical protein
MSGVKDSISSSRQAGREGGQTRNPGLLHNLADERTARAPSACLKHMANNLSVSTLRDLGKMLVDELQSPD